MTEKRQLEIELEFNTREDLGMDERVWNMFTNEERAFFIENYRKRQ